MLRTERVEGEEEGGAQRKRKRRCMMRCGQSLMRKSASGSWVCARVGFLPGTDVNIKKILTSNTNTIPASVSTAEHGGTDASSTATATATTSSGKAMLVERNKEERTMATCLKLARLYTSAKKYKIFISLSSPLASHAHSYSIT